MKPFDINIPFERDSGPTIRNESGPSYRTLEESRLASQAESKYENKSFVEEGLEFFVVDPLAELHTDPLNSRLSYLPSTPLGWAIFLALYSPPAYGGRVRFYHFDYRQSPRSGLPPHHFTAQILPDPGDDFEPLHFHLTQEAAGRVEKRFVVRDFDASTTKAKPSDFYNAPTAQYAVNRIRGDYFLREGQILEAGAWDCGYVACLAGVHGGFGWDERQAQLRGLITMFAMFKLGEELLPVEVRRFKPGLRPPGAIP